MQGQTVAVTAASASRTQTVEVGGAGEHRLHDGVLRPRQREQQAGTGQTGHLLTRPALVVVPVPQDRVAYVAQQAAQLAREARAVAAAAAGTPTAAALGVVVVMATASTATVAALLATATAATAGATLSTTPGPTALGPRGPAVGQVLAEVGPDRVPDAVEVDADGTQGLAVLVVRRGRGLGGGVDVGVGLVDGVDVLGDHDLAGCVEPQAVVGEGGVRRTSGVGEQAEQEVVGTDLGVAQLAGDVCRLGDGDPGFGVESGLHGDLLDEGL